MRVSPRPLTPPDDLGDDVVTLRLRRESDAPHITRGRRDREARRWLGDAGTVDASPAAAVERARVQWSTGQGAPFVIADARTDEPLGQIRLIVLDEDVAALAYTVYPEVRGLGVATRAVRLITRWALEELGLRAVVLETDVRNRASLRVAEKAGYRRTGERPDPQAAEDGAVLAVFEARRPASSEQDR